MSAEDALPIGWRVESVVVSCVRVQDMEVTEGRKRSRNGEIKKQKRIQEKMNEGRMKNEGMQKNEE